MREIGLPELQITPAYLRQAMSNLIAPHVIGQRDYHRYKAARLATVHHRLDGLAEWLFIFAIISVSIYLGLELGTLLQVFPDSLPLDLSKTFTFFGVAFPTLGASIAGIRFFGDFERFAAISDITAEKLDAVAQRIDLLTAGSVENVTYDRVAEIAHEIDDIVVSEIENWQAVFGGKHIALPA